MKLSTVKVATFKRVDTLLKQLNEKPLLLINQPDFNSEIYKETENELIMMIETFGKDISSYIFKKIFSEITWTKYENSKIVAVCPDLQPKNIRILGEICFQMSQKKDFDSFINELVSLIFADEKLPQDLIYNISKNIFEFFMKIGRLEFSSQLQLSLGFAQSNTFLNKIGREMIISKLEEIIGSKKKIPIQLEIYEKCYFYLFHTTNDYNLLDKKSKEGDFNTEEEIIKKLYTIILSYEWSNQTHNDKTKEIPIFTYCSEIYPEKLSFELGPTILNLKQENFIKKSKNEFLDNASYGLYDFKLTEKRLADLIIFMLNNFPYQEDKENRLMLKLFLKNISNDLAQHVDENLEKKQSLSWTLEYFYKSNKSFFDSLDQPKLFSYFDSSQFCISSKKIYDNFINILIKLKISNYLIPVLCCKGVWENVDNQIASISYLINNPNELVTDFLRKSPKVKRNPLNYDFSHLKTNQQNSYLIELWSCLEIVGGLLKIAHENISKVRALFEWPIANVPEILILCLFQLPRDSFLSTELLKEIFPMFLSGHINSTALIEDLWLNDSKKLIETLSFLYSIIPETVNLYKILELTQKVKESLMTMVCYSEDYFSISLACLAIKRDFLNIQQWLNDRIEKRGEVFILALLNFIKENLINEYKKGVNIKTKKPFINQNQISQPNQIQNNQQVNQLGPSLAFNNYPKYDKNSFNQNKEVILEKSQLTLEALVEIFNILTIYSTQQQSKVYNNNQNYTLSKSTIDEINHIYKNVFEIFEELQIPPTSSEETEKRANQLFRKLFNEETSVSSLTEQMKQLKESINKKDNEVFACMLHSMLDEYRFFVKYPEKELILMGQLFGQTINLNLVTGAIESVAMKFILDGYRNDNSKLNSFSSEAVQQFIDKIFLWPAFLEQLYNITVLSGYKGELYDKIATKYQEYLNQAESMGITQNPTGALPIGKNLSNNPNNVKNIKMNIIQGPQTKIPIQANIPQPILPQNIGNLIGNNNIVNSNIQNNMTNNFIVPNTNKVKNNKFNISNPNDHLLMNNINIYNNINNIQPIQNMNSFSTEKTQLNPNQMPFNPLTIQNRGKKTTQFNYSSVITLIKKIYESDDKFRDNEKKQMVAIVSLADKLSKMTLIVNKPVLSKDLNLKKLLIEAYTSGKLYMVVMFICKYLEDVPKSKVFHSKNPWVIGILSLLSEINNVSSILNSIKKLIEDLLKFLDQKSVPSSNLLSKLKPHKNNCNIVDTMDAKLEDIIKLIENNLAEIDLYELIGIVKQQNNEKQIKSSQESNFFIKTFRFRNLILISF